MIHKTVLMKNMSEVDVDMNTVSLSCGGNITIRKGKLVDYHPNCRSSFVEVYST